MDNFGIAIKDVQLKMLLVKILAENIDMELPIRRILFTYYQHISRGYHEYMSVWMPQNGDDPYFVGENLAMNTTSTLQS